MFVGEQPGDSQDRGGHPFVGPAEKLLHTAMQEAGIDPRDGYVTKAVKQPHTFQTEDDRNSGVPSVA